MSFFSKLSRGASIKSLDFIYIYQISNHVFLSITEHNRLKEDKEIYFQIKDSIELNRDYSILDISCYSCGKSDHLIHECPFIHYVMRPDELLRRNRKKEMFFGKQFKRNKGRNKYNARGHFVLIESSSIAVMNVIKLIRLEGLKDPKGQRVHVGSEDELEENVPMVGCSYTNIIKFKEESDFNRIIKLKFDDNSNSVSLPFRLNNRTGTDPQLFLQNQGVLSPIKGKSQSHISPKSCKSRFSRKSQNFSEMLSLESDGSENEEERIQQERKSVHEKMKGHANEYGESFQIDKIESFTKYFPQYNFKEIFKKINSKFQLNQTSTKKGLAFQNDTFSTKIELLKKKTIRYKKNPYIKAKSRESFMMVEKGIITEPQEAQMEILEMKHQMDSDALIHKEQKNYEKETNYEDYDKILSSLNVDKVAEWVRKRKE